MGSGVAAVCAVNDGKASFAVAVTDDLTGQISAVDLVRAGVEALGGKGGGGRPDMAQGRSGRRQGRRGDRGGEGGAGGLIPRPLRLQQGLKRNCAWTETGCQ